MQTSSALVDQFCTNLQCCRSTLCGRPSYTLICRCEFSVGRWQAPTTIPNKCSTSFSDSASIAQLSWRRWRHVSGRPSVILCIRILTIFTRTWLRYVRIFAIANPSIVCLSSVTFVRCTQLIETFDNISSPFCALAILWTPRKILRRSSQGNPYVGA